MYRKSLFLLIAAVAMFLGTSEAEAKEGFYVGLGAAYNTIWGDFDGHAGLQSGTEVIILPDINNALGIDILGGYGINDTWSIELNFMSSGHSGTWQGLSGDVSYNSFSINGKYSFTSSNRVQPYLLFGISSNVLLIKKGATDTSTGEVADATLSGPGVNAGVGIDDYLNPNVSLNLGIMYRYVNYTKAEGVHGSGTISGGLNGSGFSFVLTTAYHF